MGLLVAVLLLFRSHLMRTTTFIGDSDRLNHFLHSLAYDVQHLRGGLGRAWDESMFMGFSYYGVPFPFSAPTSYLQALLPTANVTAMAGYFTCLLLVAAAWTAYWYIRTLCDRPFAAFVGAAMYALSSFSVVKLSQNDNTFLIVVILPLMMRAIARLSHANVAGCFAALVTLLAAAMYFTTLQKVAYVLILLGAYATLRSAVARSWLPVGALAGAVSLAVIGSIPRLGAVFEDFALVERLTREYRSKDFDALYRFQNILPREGLRWLDDGLFGRHPAEVAAVGNGLNVQEGLLLYASLFASLLILIGIVRMRGVWFGALRSRESELTFHLGMLALVFAVIVIKPLGYLMYLLFLRIDFYHGRFSVVGILPQAVLTSLFLSRIWPVEVPRLDRGWLITRAAVAGLAGLGVVAVVGWAAQPSVTAVFGLARPIRFGPAWQNYAGALPTEVMRVAVGALLFAAVMGGLARLRGDAEVRWMLGIVLGSAMVFQALDAADFRLNGAHTQTRIPFDHGGPLTADRYEFRTPRPEALARFSERLESEKYRTALICDPTKFPAFCSAHLSQFWNLRLVEGYSLGVPTRLASLPWPDSVQSLRALSFGAAETLPWPLLATLNVKYVVKVNDEFYRNVRPGKRGKRADATPDDVEISRNPLPVAPRQFFSSAVVGSASMADAARWLQTHALGSDPASAIERESVVEGYQRSPSFGPASAIDASYHGDRVTLRFAPAPQPRFLVINELYHPRWKAYAGGQEVVVHPVNVVMRGVVVPSGADHVTMRFVPFLYSWVALLSVATAFALTAMIAVCLRYQTQLQA